MNIHEEHGIPCKSAAAEWKSGLSFFLFIFFLSYFLSFSPSFPTNSLFSFFPFFLPLLSLFTPLGQPHLPRYGACQLPAAWHCYQAAHNRHLGWGDKKYVHLSWLIVCSLFHHHSPHPRSSSRSTDQHLSTPFLHLTPVFCSSFSHSLPLFLSLFASLSLVLYPTSSCSN